MLAAAMLALLAGVVRGFAGFGYAVIVVLGLNLLLSPQAALATAILLDLACCLGLLREAARHCHRPLLGRLLLGMLLALPVGLWVVSWLPAGVMAQLVGGISLLGGLLLLLNRPLPALARRFAVSAGIASGLAMTTASAGGPPLMVYLLNQPLPAAAQRATAILFFALCSAAVLLGFGCRGLLGAEVWHMAALMLLPSLLGNQLGQWLFRRYRPQGFRRGVAPLLMLMSLWVLLR
ncbi:MAG: sulfite exporter TauE/SafE family protein [Aeromonadaceae bacterium]